MAVDYHLISVVWGEKYINFFLDVTLPNYLSANNIPLASKKYSLISKIYTTPQDALRIQSHPHFHKLLQSINVQVIPVITDALLQKNKYLTKGYCIATAIREAIATQSVGLLTPPDALIADGGLEKCCSLIQEGNKVILIAGLTRSELESTLPRLKKYYDPKTCSITISNRKLIDLGTTHLHKIALLSFWNKHPFTNWPSIIYWKANNKSLLAKFFHLQPLAIDFRGIFAKIPEILMADDGGLVDFLEIPQNKRYVVTNTDEIACVEFSSQNMESECFSLSARKYSMGVINWASLYTLKSDKRYFKNYNFRFQGSEEVDWQSLEKQMNHDIFWIRILLTPASIIHSILKNIGTLFLIRKFLSLCRRVLISTTR